MSAPLEWAPLFDAMRAAPDAWIPTTPHMFEEMRDCLPPRAMGRGAFLVGEPNHHNERGRAVYACFRRNGEAIEARYMTHAEFIQLSQVTA